MPTTPSVRGRFLWHELLTGNPEIGKAFYPKVIGWGTTEWTGMETPYTMWTAEEMPVGGIMPMPLDALASGGTPSWLSYVGTDSVSDTLAQVRDLGGSVMMGPMDIPTIGQIGVCMDPQGAAFAVYTPVTAPPEAPSPVLDFSWHELATSDYQSALVFYGALFGWELVQAMDMGPDGVYAIIGRGGQPFGGMFNRPAGMPGGTAWLPYVRVVDLDRAASVIKTAGGQVVIGPVDVPDGRIIHAVDPEGVPFALHEQNKVVAVEFPKATGGGKPVQKSPATKKPKGSRRAAKTAGKKAGKKAGTKSAKKAQKRVAKKSPARTRKAKAKKASRKPVRGK